MKLVMLPGRSLENSNPFVTLLCESLERAGVTLMDSRWDVVRRGECNLVHVHWPENLAAGDSTVASIRKSLRMAVSVLAGKRRGVKVVWTVHNAVPHAATQRRFTSFAYAFFSRTADLTMYLSDAGRAAVTAQNPRLRKKRSVVVPHGHYRDSYVDAGLDVAQARRQLKLPLTGNVLLVLGQIRANKNLVSLADAFLATAGAGTSLVIAGWPKDPATVSELTERANRDSRLVLRALPVEAGDVVTYLRAANAVLTPYAIPSSGSVMLALSFDTPVVAFRSPAIDELAHEANLQSWVTTVDRMDDLVRTAESCTRPSGRADLSAFDWAHVGQATAQAYSALLQRQPSEQSERYAQKSTAGMKETRSWNE
jgi:beta-1,4-mannosyltransferase